MQIRFLVLDHEGIFLLGYPLKLSATQQKLLWSIAEGGRRSVDDLHSLLPSGVGRGNVTVHINAINRKAAEISRRKLVIYRKGKYEINPLM